MSGPMYFAMGGAIWVREHQPITLQKAELIRTVHCFNAAHWLANGDERSLTARLALAKTEQSLADEMAEAIRAVSQSEQKEAA